MPLGAIEKTLQIFYSNRNVKWLSSHAIQPQRLHSIHELCEDRVIAVNVIDPVIDFTCRSKAWPIGIIGTKTPSYQMYMLPK